MSTIEQDRIDAAKYRSLRLSLESFIRDNQNDMLYPDPTFPEDEITEHDRGMFEGRQWMDTLWRGMLQEELEELDERIK